MARGDVVFRRHALEGVEPPKKTKRIKSGSKATTSSFSRDPQTASAGLVAETDRQHPLPPDTPPVSPTVEAEGAGAPVEPKAKRKPAKKQPAKKA